MPVFFETEPILIASQISELEKFIDLSFPESYKLHLMKYNGGRCTPNVFKFTENEKLTSSSIDWFLAIYEGKYDSLRNYIISFKIEEKRLPKHILPIAHDSGGNLICISCGNFDNGRVYFWSHEREIDYGKSDNNDYSNLYLVSENFDEFLGNLTS